MQFVLRANVITDADSPPINDCAIHVEDDRVRAVGPWRELSAADGWAALPVADHRDRWVIPGLIDVHVHLTLPGDGSPEHRFYAEHTDEFLFATAIANANAALKSGVTTMRDCGGKIGLVVGLKRAFEAGVLHGPRLFVAGPPLTITGGHCAYMGGEVDSVDAVKALSRRLLKEGADFLKMMGSGGGTPGTQHHRTTFDISEIRAARAEARRAGTHLAIHATNCEAVRVALEAGVDTIEHATLTSERSDTSYDLSLVDALAESGVIVSPTLQASFGTVRYLERRHAAGELSPQQSRELDARRLYLDCRIDQSVKMFEGGVPVASSSDAGWMINPFGDFVTGLEMLSHAGVANREIFRAATEVPARALGRRDLGRLEAGALADMVVLDRNPLRDLSALRSAEAVYVGGQLFRNELSR